MAERRNGEKLESHDAELATSPYDPMPELVAEVVSPTYTYSALDEKVDVYLNDGVKCIWLVNPWGKKVMVVSSDDAARPLILRGDAVLGGGDVLPGFKLALADLFKSL